MFPGVLHAEAADPSGARVECSAGIAFYVVIMSAIQKPACPGGYSGHGRFDDSGQPEGSALDQ